MKFPNHKTKIFHTTTLLTILIGFLLLHSAISYLNTAYVVISSSGTLVPAVKLLETYKSEVREVAVIDFTSVYANEGHCNWTIIAQTLAAYNITGIASCLLFNYKAYYPSQYVGSVLDRDEIALAVQAAHQYGLDFRLEFAVLYKSPKDEWKVKTADGSLYNWLDPTNPQARQHILNLVSEVVTNYDIDDLSLDYIRYDGEDMPYTETARQQLSQYLGETIANWPGPFAPGGARFSEFLQWRMIPINTLVKEIYELAKSIKPNITVSACTRYWPGSPGWELAGIGQDPITWVKDGYLDRLIPMTYQDNVDDALLSIDAYLDYAVAGPEGAVPLTPYLSICPGETPLTPQQFAPLVNAVRNRGCDGFVIAAYGGPGDNPNNPDSLPDIRNYLNVLSLPGIWELTGITVQILSASSVKIAWETTAHSAWKIEYNNVPLFNATLEYAEPYPYPRIYYWNINYYPGTIIQNTTYATNHQVTLTNLQKDKLYYFRIQSQNSLNLISSKVYTLKL
jgi:hypothetical protein